MQDPEVNSIELQAEPGSIVISAEVRIVRNSACCNDEMKEYTFNTDHEVSVELADKIQAIWDKTPEVEFDVEEAGVDMLEEGGHRYKKSYYGYTLQVAIKHDGNTIGTVEITDKIEASSMDELN